MSQSDTYTVYNAVCLCPNVSSSVCLNAEFDKFLLGVKSRGSRGQSHQVGSKDKCSVVVPSGGTKSPRS